MSTDWQRDPKGVTENHWIDLISDVDENGEYWWKCYVKWDGCLQIDRAFNVPFMSLALSSRSGMCHWSKLKRNCCHFGGLVAITRSMARMTGHVYQIVTRRAWKHI